MRYGLTVVLCACVLVSAGCSLTRQKREEVLPYSYPLTEPEWIRNGDPIPFDGGQWYPTDELENLLDSEVYPAGHFRDIVFFVDRADVKPLERVYTRFSRNRYRAFEKRP